MRVNLSINIDYDEATVDVDADELCADLERRVRNAIGNGLLTGDGPEIVDEYSVETVAQGVHPAPSGP